MNRQLPSCFCSCANLFGARLILVVTLTLGIPAMVVGQQVTRSDFDATMLQWKETCKEVRRCYMEFRASEEEQADQWRKKWFAAVRRGDQLYLQAVDQASQIFAQSPVPDPDLQEFLVFLRTRYYETGQYDRSLAIARAMVQQDPGDAGLVLEAARTAFFGNHFSESAQLLNQLRTQIGELPGELARLEIETEKFTQAWTEEQQRREQEAQADDLPRVRLETSKGAIEIELFENEAPNSVANFIHLVESGFYDGLKFHRVIEHFVVHGGCPLGNGQGGPDYRIPTERLNPDARRHFAGTVSLISSVDGNYAGSQFFIVKTPMSGFDQVHTAIGRVISGLDVVNRLTTTVQKDISGRETPVEQANADRIITAKMIRKRDHPYEPEKVH